jgi:hypothetical protein
MAYAHSLIEVPVDPEDVSKGVIKYDRGDSVPTNLPGMDELIEGGAVSNEQYDPSIDVVGPPMTIDIDGITYIQASEAHGEETHADAR